MRQLCTPRKRKVKYLSVNDCYHQPESRIAIKKMEETRKKIGMEEVKFYSNDKLLVELIFIYILQKMKTISIFLLIVLVKAASTLILVRENIVFEKVNTIATTYANG